MNEKAGFLRSCVICATLLIAPAARASAKSQLELPASGHIVCDVRNYGATGDKSQNATHAFRNAVEACARKGGGTVDVPPGAYTSGPIELESNITFQVDAAATVYLSKDPEDFLGHPNVLLYTRGAHNVSITGKGTLDGEAEYRWGYPESPDPEIETETALARAAGEDMRRSLHVGRTSHLIWLQNSRDTRIEDISVRNSSNWSVEVDSSDRVSIRRVHVSTSLTMGVNGDGIDIVSSRNVLVSDSVVSTGDDAIVLKTLPRNGVALPTENVVVENCVLISSSTPLMIGTETSANIRHVLFRDIIIRDSNKGFGINVQDGGTVSDVRVSNVSMQLRRRHWNWWGSAEAFKIVLKKRTPDSKIGTIRNITLEYLDCHTEGTSLMEGLAQRPLENIRVSHLRIFMHPEETPDKRATDAIRIVAVRGMTLSNVDVSWSSKPEDTWRNALRLTNVKDFVIDGFSANRFRTDGPEPVALDGTCDGKIRSSSTVRQSDSQLKLNGSWWKKAHRQPFSVSAPFYERVGSKSIREKHVRDRRIDAPSGARSTSFQESFSPNRRPRPCHRKLDKVTMDCIQLSEPPIPVPSASFCFDSAGGALRGILSANSSMLVRDRISQFGGRAPAMSIESMQGKTVMASAEVLDLKPMQPDSHVSGQHLSHIVARCSHGSANAELSGPSGQH